MIISFTTTDKINISDFNSPILLIDLDNNTKKEMSYLEAMKYTDLLVTSHLDGFDAENVTTHGVIPVRYTGSITNAIEELKDCGLKRSLPIGENGTQGSCGI